MSEDLPYEVEDWAIVAQVSNLRVITMTLAEGQRVPWHIHTEVTDIFFCLEGALVVEHPAGRPSAGLGVGESYVVEPGTPHRATGKDGGRVRFMIVQGIGTYDFVPVEVNGALA